MGYNAFVHVLAIESSGSIGGVALLGPEESFEISVPLGAGRGEVLPELVRDLLLRAKIGWEQISLIAVDIGPGSFTGLRMGLSLAKALAQVHGIPLVGVRQTEAVGLPLAELWPGRVCVWIHDRREFLYMAWVDRERAGAENVLSVSQALAKVRERSAVLLAGTGALRFASDIKAQAKEVTLAPPALSYPRPLVVAQIGLARYTRDGPVDILALEPHYVHKEGEHG